MALASAHKPVRGYRTDTPRHAAKGVKGPLMTIGQHTEPFRMNSDDRFGYCNGQFQVYCL
jgi:hypothetical protein